MWLIQRPIFAFPLCAAMLALFSADLHAAVTVDPIGVAVAVDNEDTLAVEVTLTNDGDEDVAFEIKFDGVDRGEQWRLIPRRDQPDGRFALFQDTETFGWVDQWLFRNINGLDYEWFRNADDLVEVDLFEFDALWVETGNQTDRFRQLWNENLERFEEYVSRGHAMFIEQGHNEGENVQRPTPGGLLFQWAPQNGILAVGPEDNWLVEQMGWDEGLQFPGNFFTHVIYPQDNLEQIEDSDWFQVIARGDNGRLPAVVVYNYGRGHVVASGSPCGHQWRWHNQQDRWGSCGETMMEWLLILGAPQWLSAIPEEGAIPAGESIVVELVFTPLEMEEGEHELLVEIELDDERQPLIEFAAVMSLGSPAADISGAITDAENNNPVAGARVDLDYYIMSRFSDDDGVYSFPNLPPRVYTLTYSAVDFLPTTREVELGEDAIEVDVALLHSEFNPSVEDIDEVLGLEAETHVSFEASNDGNGPLAYTVERRLLGDANADPWELRRAYNVGAEVEDSRLEGVAFDGEHFYVAGHQNGNVIYVLDREGGLASTLDQPGADEGYMRDLAYDGELLWGAAGRTVFGFTTDGEIDAEFEGPYNPTSAVAWDPDREVLWLAGTTSNPVAYDRDGNAGAELNRRSLRIYGLAYWPEDPDGYNLYFFHSPSGGLQVVTKMDVADGDTLPVRQLMPEGGGRPGGAFITNTFDVYSWVFMGLANEGADDRIDIWQLDARRDWMRIDPDRGVIEADAAQEFDLLLSSHGLPAVRFEGELVFIHDGVGSETHIPVTLDVVEGPAHARRTLQLDFGWNMVSVNLQPDEEDVTVLTEPLVEAGVLEMMKDGFGRFYRPEFGFNNIPRWAVDQGYQMKVTADAELTLEGISVLADDPIALIEGWQIVSYYPRDPVDAVLALSGIVDVLELAKDGFGNFYNPEFGFSNMGDMREGRGYQVKVTQDVELVYNMGEGRAAVLPLGGAAVPSFDRAPVHFVEAAPTGRNMSVLLNAECRMQNAEYFEVGAFTEGGLCVGSASSQSAIFNPQSSILGFAVWGDDLTTAEIDGAREGEALIFKLCDGAGEYVVSPEWQRDEGVYYTDGFAYGTLDLSSFIPHPSSLILLDPYPNPFNDRTAVRFGLPVESFAEVALYDLNGRRIETIVSRRLLAGVHTALIDGAKNLASGVYVVQVSAAGELSRRKVTFIK